MRPRQGGKVWLDKDMPGSSHSVTSWFGVPKEGQSQDTAPYHRGLQRKWEYCTCAQEQGKWPEIASTKTMDLGFDATAPLCSTDSRQDRTDEQKKGPNVCIPGLKSQDYYIPHHCSTTSATTSTSQALSSCPVTKLSVL